MEQHTHCLGLTLSHLRSGLNFSKSLAGILYMTASSGQPVPNSAWTDLHSARAWRTFASPRRMGGGLALVELAVVELAKLPSIGGVV